VIHFTAEERMQLRYIAEDAVNAKTEAQPSANKSYLMAAPPATVLALINEIEELRKVTNTVDAYSGPTYNEIKLRLREAKNAMNAAVVAIVQASALQKDKPYGAFNLHAWAVTYGIEQDLRRAVAVIDQAAVMFNEEPLPLMSDRRLSGFEGEIQAELEGVASVRWTVIRERPAGYRVKDTYTATITGDSVDTKNIDLLMRLSEALAKHTNDEEVAGVYLLDVKTMQVYRVAEVYNTTATVPVEAEGMAIDA
jgi:hypothetical protein